MPTKASMPVEPAPIVPAPAPVFTGPQKPGKVQAVAIMTLISGISNILYPIVAVIVFLAIGLPMLLTIGIATMGIGLALACLCLPLGLLPIAQIILGVFEIIYAAKLLPTPIKPTKPSQAIAIMEIICIVTLNPVPLAAGIVALIMYSDPVVKDYFLSQ